MDAEGGRIEHAVGRWFHRNAIGGKDGDDGQLRNGDADADRRGHRAPAEIIDGARAQEMRAGRRFAPQEFEVLCLPRRRLRRAYGLGVYFANLSAIGKEFHRPHIAMGTVCLGDDINRRVWWKLRAVGGRRDGYARPFDAAVDNRDGCAAARRILHVSGTGNRSETGHHSFRPFNECVAVRDEHQKGRQFACGNNNALGEGGIIGRRRGGAGIAEIDAQIGVCEARAAHDETGIGAIGIGRAVFGRLRIFRRRRFQTDNRQGWRIHSDVHRRRGRPQTE